MGITTIRILIALLKRVKLNNGGVGFDQATSFSENSRERLKAHYSRILGTLTYWKNQACAYGRLYRHAVISTIVSAVLIPVLIQVYDRQDIWARVFLTVLSTWIGLLIALSRGFKAEELFRGFRKCESDFYDVRRQLMDRPKTFGDDEEKQLESYFEFVGRIRKAGRDLETNNPPSASLL